MTVINLHFDDFKGLSKDRRIYYYIDENYYDFHFLVDGIIVKSTLAKNSVENKKQFFSDAMFYGAKELTFKIPTEMVNPLEEVKKISVPMENPVLDIQDEEVKKTDIQEDGVDSDRESE